MATSAAPKLESPATSRLVFASNTARSQSPPLPSSLAFTQPSFGAVKLRCTLPALPVAGRSLQARKADLVLAIRAVRSSDADAVDAPANEAASAASRTAPLSDTPATGAAAYPNASMMSSGAGTSSGLDPR